VAASRLRPEGFFVSLGGPFDVVQGKLAKALVATFLVVLKPRILFFYG
jgi:hypothetical protein